MAMGGSTNALIHLVAMAGRAGIKLPLERFNEFSAKVPLLANVRPSGDKYLMEDFYYAGGLRALLHELRDLLDLGLRHRQRQDARREPRRRAHLQRRRDPQAKQAAEGVRRPGGAARQPRAQRRGDQGRRRPRSSSTPARRWCSTTTTTWRRASTATTSTATRTRCWCCATPARSAAPACPSGACCRCRRSCSSRACATWCASRMRA